MWRMWEMCEWNSEKMGHKEAQRWMENQKNLEENDRGRGRGMEGMCSVV